MKVAIDMDVLKYRCGFAAERRWYYDIAEPDIRYANKRDATNAGVPEDRLEFDLEVEPVENALHNFKEVMYKIRDACKAKTYVGFLSGGANFREQLATIKPYKGNRDPLHKPVHYDALHNYAVRKWKAKVIDGMEADDAMAILGTRYKNKIIMASIDKDLLQVPGYHYNFMRDEFYFINDDQGMMNFYFQVLTGDATDNIPGCPKIGPAKAQKILAGLVDEVQLYEATRLAYTQAYTDPGLADKNLVENARLCWLLREPKQVWNPPQPLNV